MIVDKPWGHEIRWAITDRYLGKILHINSGQKLSRQYHEVKDESIYVLKGVLILEVGSGKDLYTHILREGQTYRVRPGTIHRFAAPADGYVKLIEVSTPVVDDVIRIEDVYGRAK